MIGWGLTFEMFQETGIRGDTFADAVDGGLAYLALLRRPHRRRLAGRHRDSPM